MDLNAVNNRLSNAVLNAGRLDALLVHLGYNIQHQARGTVYRFPCPIHGGRGRNIQLRTDGFSLPIWWKCFSHSCHARYLPNLLGFVRGVLSAAEGQDVPPRVAANYIREFLGDGPVDWSSRPRPAPKPKLLCLTREQVRQALEIPSPYFQARGFSAEILDVMDVGHSRKLGRSVLPLYDGAGDVCIGYLSRSEKPGCDRCRLHHEAKEGCGAGEPRWRAPAGFPRGSYLYGYAAAAHSESPFVVLVEWAPDALRVMEAGYPAVASLGADLTEVQAEKLAALNKQVLVVFDNDEAGQQGAVKAVTRLQGKKAWARAWSPPKHYKDMGDVPRQEVVVAWVEDWRQDQEELDRILGPAA